MSLNTQYKYCWKYVSHFVFISRIQLDISKLCEYWRILAGWPNLATYLAILTKFSSVNGNQLLSATESLPIDDLEFFLNVDFLERFSKMWYYPL